METQAIAVIATLAWFITVYKFNAMRRNGWWRAQSVTFYLWTFLFCTAIGLTLMIEPLYLAFDRFTGLPNFGWLVLYISFSVAIYSVSAGCYRILRQHRPRIILWSLLITLLVLIAEYMWGIVRLPEKPDHTVPATLAEIIFMETLYVYLAALAAIPIVTFTWLFRDEKLLPARLRWLAALTVSLLSTSAFIMKIMLTLLTYQGPAPLAMKVLYPLINAVVLVVGILAPICFLPNSFYLMLARPFEFCGKILALFELRLLQSQLNALCPPVFNDTPGWSISLKNLDFRLYRTVIGILDAKRMLAGYAETTNGLIISTTTDAEKAGQLPSPWDERKLKQARIMLSQLKKVDDHVEYLDLVRAYQEVSRSIRWKIWTIPFQGESSGDFVYQH